MTQDERIPLAVTYKLRDALTAVHGRTQILARRLDDPDANVARAREDAARVLECLARLEAILAEHDGDVPDHSGHDVDEPLTA